MSNNPPKTETPSTNKSGLTSDIRKATSALSVTEKESQVREIVPPRLDVDSWDGITTPRPPEAAVVRFRQPSQESVSAEPSAIVLVSPRSFHSQNLEGRVSSEDLKEFINDVEGTSGIALRTSRGKSNVNLGYSRSSHFTPSTTCHSSKAPSTYFENRRNVKFKPDLPPGYSISQPNTTMPTAHPEQQIFPSPHYDKPIDNLKPDYDFYTPGQTMENVKDKVLRMKNRLIEMKKTLMKTHISKWIPPGCVPQPVEDSPANSNNCVDQPSSNIPKTPDEDLKKANISDEPELLTSDGLQHTSFSDIHKDSPKNPTKVEELDDVSTKPDLSVNDYKTESDQT